MIVVVLDYDIVIVTGDERGAGTDSQVHVVLFGSQGRRTEKLHLKTSKNHKNPFERNQSDRFVVRGDYIGDLVKMRIEHDNSGRAPGWFLDRVKSSEMIIEMNSMNFMFIFSGCRYGFTRTRSEISRHMSQMVGER